MVRAHIICPDSWVSGLEVSLSAAPECLCLAWAWVERFAAWALLALARRCFVYWFRYSYYLPFFAGAGGCGLGCGCTGACLATSDGRGFGSP